MNVKAHLVSMATAPITSAIIPVIAMQGIPEAIAKQVFFLVLQIVSDCHSFHGPIDFENIFLNTKILTSALVRLVFMELVLMTSMDIYAAACRDIQVFCVKLVSSAVPFSRNISILSRFS